MTIDNILVTGNSEFIGKNLWSCLKGIGISCYNHVVGLDITDMSFLKSLHNVKLIVHLAAKTSIKDSIANPYETYYNNLIGTLNLLEFVRLKGLKKFIYTSTYVYGQPGYLPIDEKQPVNLHSHYNKSKLMAEELCKNYSADFDIDMAQVQEPALLSHLFFSKLRKVRSSL
jgi:nucleoside-diphosphate-sugar epimerase